MDRTANEIIEDFKVKLNTGFKEDAPNIEDDREYSFALGQALDYILSFSKSASPEFHIYNLFLRTDNDKKLRNELRKLFIKYSSNMPMIGPRLRSILDMIYRYDRAKKIDKDMLMCGIFSRSLLYEKKKNKEEKSDDEK